MTENRSEYWLGREWDGLWSCLSGSNATWTEKYASSNRYEEFIGVKILVADERLQLNKKNERYNTFKW